MHIHAHTDAHSYDVALRGLEGPDSPCLVMEELRHEVTRLPPVARFGRADEAGTAVLQAMMGLYEVDETSQYGGGPSRDVIVRSVTIEAG